MAEINLISAKIDSLQVHTATYSNKEPLWTEVVARKKKTTHPQHRGPYNIPVISNRYYLLPPSEKCIDRETTPLNVEQQIGGTKASNPKRNKIVILGGSHARGCAREVKHNLDHTYEIQVTVKPGANLTEIVLPQQLRLLILQKKDVIVVWGGTLDIGRNEYGKALQQIRNFVQNHNQTNMTVMSAPYRHDLDANSCVNKEVTVYNRKLKKKYLKVFDNTQIVEVDSQRELFTRHGLHTNLNGKEQMVKKIVVTIKSMLQKKKINPIIMTENDLGAYDVGYRSETIPKHDTTEPVTTQETTTNNTNSVTRTSTRHKKPPNTMLKDFLW